MGSTESRGKLASSTNHTLQLPFYTMHGGLDLAYKALADVVCYKGCGRIQQTALYLGGLILGVCSCPAAESHGLIAAFLVGLMQAIAGLATPECLTYGSKSIDIDISTYIGAQSR